MVKAATDYTLAELFDLSEEEVIVACAAAEAPLIDELERLGSIPLAHDQWVNRKIEIRDARLRIHQIYKVWKKLHATGGGGKQRITAAGLKP